MGEVLHHRQKNELSPLLRSQVTLYLISSKSSECLRVFTLQFEIIYVEYTQRVSLLSTEDSYLFPTEMLCPTWLGKKFRCKKEGEETPWLPFKFYFVGMQNLCQWAASLPGIRRD